MGIINYTGFEQGNALSSNGGDDHQPFGGSGGSVQSTIKKHGTYAAEFIKTTTGSCYVSVNGARDNDGNINLNSGSWGTLYMQGYLRYTTKAGSNSEQVMEIHGTGGDAIAELHLDLNGKLRIYDFNNYGTPVLLGTGTTTLNANTWYKISLKIVAGSSGSYELLIDDAAELSGSRSWAITLNLRNVFLGARRDRNGQSTTFYWDDYASSDTAYPFATGEFAVGVLKPNANGSPMSWTGGTGASDYTQVDEIPIDDADYVQSPTSGNPNVALFDFQSRADAGLMTGTIAAVKLIGITRENSSVSSATKLRIKSGASSSDSSGFNGSTVTVGLGRLLTLDPNGSVAWTGSAIDALQAGAVEDNAVAVRLISALVHVLYEVSTVVDVTVNASVVTATFSTPAPTVTAIRNETISPAPQVATFSTPAVSVRIDVSVSPSPQVATFSLPAPTVSTDGNVTVSATVVTATFSTPAPTIDVVSNMTVNASVVTATFSLPTPTITGEQNAVVSPLALTATFSLPVPTITAEQSVTVSPNAVVATFSLPAPNVYDEQIVSASVVTATFSIPTPTITAIRNVTISASVVVATFSLPRPRKTGGIWTPQPRDEGVWTPTARVAT